MKKIFMLIACGFAAQFGSALGMEGGNFYSQPCCMQAGKFVPMLLLTLNTHDTIYRIKNRHFFSSSSYILTSDVNSFTCVESIGENNKGLSTTPKDIIYDAEIGRWSDELGQSKLAEISSFNQKIWPNLYSHSKKPRHANCLKFSFDDNDGPPSFDEETESLMAKKDPKKEPSAKKGTEKNINKKDDSPVAEEKKEAVKKIVSPGAQKTQEEELKQGTDPKKPSPEPSSWFTPKCIFFAFASVGILGSPVFAAVQYAKKKKLKKSEALDQNFEKQIFEEQEPESIVAQ